MWETKRAAAFQALRDAQLEPIYFLYSTNESHPCRCMLCGRGYSTRIWNVWTKGGRGCAHCARRLSMSLEQTEVYVLVHEGARAVKVGISRQHFARGHNRVRAHERRGWRLHRSLSLRTARLAYDIEQAVIDRLRLDLYVPPADVDMPQHGRTETAPAALVPPDLLWDLVCDEAGRLITETPADHRDRPPRPARGRNHWGRPQSVEDVRFGRLVRELPEGARSTERHRAARSRVADQQREAAYSVWGEHYAPYGIWDGDSATIAGSRYAKENIGHYLSGTAQTAREREAYAAWVADSSTMS
ncbi:hypothetical protein [Streptomyces sp. NPDC017940]|uniref:hypothetical protein n=1 Tax=Streptomyces sp. NPDC017940 TaxID=3365017 RepID=UPI00378F1AA7